MLSVVVPVRGDTRLLLEQLEALRGQEAPSAFEVVVADNSLPGDRSVAEAVAALAARWSALRYVDATARAGAAYARNVGAARAAGDLLAFVDADDVVSEGWARAIIEALDEHPVVASRFEYSLLNSPQARAGRGPVQSGGLIEYRRPPFLPHAGGCGLAMWRSAFEGVGGFDESYAVLEDTELCWRLQLAGHQLWFEHGAVVHIRLRESLRGSFKQAFSYGEAHAKLQREYRSRGLPALGPGSTLRSLLGVVRSSPALFDPARRARFVRSLGHRLGRWVGSLRYRVWAG